MRPYLALIFLVSLLLISASAPARMLYGFYLPDLVLEQKVKEKMNAEMLQHPLLTPKKDYIVAIERPHQSQNRNLEFLLIAGLLIIIGIFRLANPSYLRNLLRAFRNPSLSTRQLKEQLRQDSPASLTMDLIFCISLGLYLYFTLKHIHNKHLLSEYPMGFVMLGFILLFVIVYVVRFLFLKFTGWAFNISEITDNYTFNVFLINKILGLVIIPFTVILAFGQGQWVQACLLISLLLIAILFLNRYLRSGVVFGYFLKFSKFHFFMYLCASELLPLAVLMKLVNEWLIS